MKQLATLVAAGAMAVLLTACSEQPKQPEVRTETTTVTQPEQPAVQHQTTVEENAAPKQE
jgi:uncharacterized lipoprotein YbaY